MNTSRPTYPLIFSELLDFSFKFQDFLKSDKKNIIIETDIVRLYTRKSLRCFSPEGFTECLDIANITVVKKYRNKGICTAIINYLEDAARHINNDASPTAVCSRGVFIESVLTEGFANSLIKNGYTPKDMQLDLFDHFVSVDLYKIID